MVKATKTTKEKAREGGHSGNCILRGGLYCPICRPEAGKIVPQVKKRRWHDHHLDPDRVLRPGHRPQHRDGLIRRTDATLK